MLQIRPVGSSIPSRYAFSPIRDLAHVGCDAIYTSCAELLWCSKQQPKIRELLQKINCTTQDLVDLVLMVRYILEQLPNLDNKLLAWYFWEISTIKNEMKILYASFMGDCLLRAILAGVSDLQKAEFAAPEAVENFVDKIESLPSLLTLVHEPEIKARKEDIEKHLVTKKYIHIPTTELMYSIDRDIAFMGEPLVRQGLMQLDKALFNSEKFRNFVRGFNIDEPQINEVAASLGRLMGDLVTSKTALEKIRDARFENSTAEARTAVFSFIGLVGLDIIIYHFRSAFPRGVQPYHSAKAISSIDLALKYLNDN